MQQLNPENIPRVTNVSFHKIKERTNFTHSVLWFHSVCSKYFNRFLPDVKVFCSFKYQLTNNRGRSQGALVPAGHTHDANAWNDMATGQLNHSQILRIRSIGTMTRCSSWATSISAKATSGSPVVDKSTTRPFRTSLPCIQNSTC